MYNVRLPLVVNKVEVSTVVSLNLAEITFRAKPSLISLATSDTVRLCLKDLTLPSGNVMLIIVSFI